MLRNIIIYLILLSCTKRLPAQPAWHDSLVTLEYKIFSMPADSDASIYKLQKLDLYLTHGDYTSAALKEAKRVNISSLDSSQRINFFWNATILGYLNNDFDYAKFYLSKYEEASTASSIEEGLLKIMIYKNSDTAEVSRLISILLKKDSSFKCLDCINKVTTYKRKNRKLFATASAIIPGAGSMMNGNIARGLISLALNGAWIYGVYEMVQAGLYFNALSWGAGVGLKLYGGNIRLTKVLFDRKESRIKNKLAAHCEQQLEKVLNKYPLGFRPLF